MLKPLPSYELLHELFEYRGGELFWRVGTGRSRIGARVGYKHPDGYIQTKIDGESYLVHRLVWKLRTGTEPSDTIDHRNGDRMDNRIDNLRLATKGQNSYNQRVRADSTSAVKGVSLEKTSGLWKSRIQYAGRAVFLGRFATKDAAHEAYKKAALKYHGEFANFGEI